MSLAKKRILQTLRARQTADKLPPLPRADKQLLIDAGGSGDWKTRLEQMHASVEEVNSVSAAIDAVVKKAQEWSIDAAVLAPSLKSWQAACNDKGLAVHTGVAEGSDRLSVGKACAGVMESGALVMLSSADSPVRNHFLPEYSVIVIDAQDILPTLEDVWQEMKVRQTAIPRTINIITGPSKTADIEQTMVYGAHGPRVLHVVMLREQLLA